jgi:hypothetical protein
MEMTLFAGFAICNVPSKALLSKSAIGERPATVLRWMLLECVERMSRNRNPWAGGSNPSVAARLEARSP